MTKITKNLKGVKLEYDKEEQTLIIRTGENNRVKVNKVYMFSIFTFIKQISISSFIKKGDMRKLARLKSLKANKNQESLFSTRKVRVTK